jgi:hypothetical protein
MGVAEDPCDASRDLLLMGIDDNAWMTKQHCRAKPMAITRMVRINDDDRRIGRIILAVKDIFCRQTNLVHV